jgi:hypothetical protein
MNAAAIDSHIVILFDLRGEIFNSRAVDNNRTRRDELIA